MQINTTTQKVSGLHLAWISSFTLLHTKLFEQICRSFWINSPSFLASQALPHSLPATTSLRSFFLLSLNQESLLPGPSLFPSFDPQKNRQLFQKRQLAYLPSRCTSRSPPPPSSPRAFPPTVICPRPPPVLWVMPWRPPAASRCTTRCHRTPTATSRPWPRLASPSPTTTPPPATSGSAAATNSATPPAAPSRASHRARPSTSPSSLPRPTPVWRTSPSSTWPRTASSPRSTRGMSTPRPRPVSLPTRPPSAVLFPTPCLMLAPPRVVVPSSGGGMPVPSTRPT